MVDSMKRSQFNIRSLLIAMAFVAVLAAWWVDRSWLASRVDELESPSPHPMLQNIPASAYSRDGEQLFQQK
jgi:hypothetical protein